MSEEQIARDQNAGPISFREQPTQIKRSRHRPSCVEVGSRKMF